MSEQNVPQHWKNETCVTGSSSGSASAVSVGEGGCNYFNNAKSSSDIPTVVSVSGIVPVVSITSSNNNNNVIINATNRVLDPSSSSSFTISSTNVGANTGAGSSSSAVEMFNQQHNQIVQQQQQHQQHNLAPSLEFRLTKLQNFAKLSGFDTALGQHIPEDEKLRKVQQIVETGISDHAKQQILQILDKISLLKPSERLLLYLRMPGGTPETDPLRQPQNPLGTRSEINHTINWVRSHLEHDPKVSIPKQDVYNDYITYCDRIDIKPLSTADFGKVMKQVFPEIRPRRLGTRGHSRYCYAAMRKATKLDPPRLPDIGSSANMSDFNGVLDEDSWKIIKMWAEGLLNSSFDTLKDLATHITKHHLNTPASNSSRLLLQKKLLQREAKEKRKFTDNSPLKKRRKKKRRSSSSSESVQQQQQLQKQQQQQAVGLDGALITVKSENLGGDCMQQPHSIQLQHQGAALTQSGQQHQQQLLPMNLASDSDNNNMRKIQGTNLGCDTNLVVVGCTPTTKNSIAQNMSTICAPFINKDSNKLVAMTHNLVNDHSGGGITIKEELPDDYNQNVLCKKVRQAHQSKGTWNSPQAEIGAVTSGSAVDGGGGGSGSVTPIELQQQALQRSGSTEHSSTVVNNNYQNLQSETLNMMGPPAQVDMNHEYGSSTLKRSILNSGNSSKSSLPMSSNIVLRAKKLRYLQAKAETMNDGDPAATAGGSGVTDGVDKDVLSENFGMPRERVISICNMDRHELDGYLNGEDNSQDQEAELLQYFQPKDNNKYNENLKGTNNTSSTSNLSMLEHHQLENSNSKGDKKTLARKEQDDITQLRYYLHQNLQSGKDAGDGQHMNKSLNSSNSYGGMYAGGPASASLAMMSQRHLSGTGGEDHTNSLRCCNPNENSTVLGGNTNMRGGSRRKINLNARSCVPHSPNTRRKNFSFVPISPNTHHAGNSMDYSPFVSPRSTPVVRKPPLHKQHSLPLADHNMADPMIAANGNVYCKMNNMNVISASAPPSPSLVQQRFQFVPATSSSSVTSLNNCNEQQFNQFQSVGIQCRGQNTGCGIEGIGERSQSVPLHCRSPAFSQSGNYQGFSSACSSVAQTPVPPEFADFSDPSSILDIFSDANPSVKLENNEIGTSLLDVDLTSAESAIGMNDLLPHDFDTKCSGVPTTSITSRSVPSTPLSMLGFKNKGSNGNGNNHELNSISKMYDMSKSVPTTPIAMNVAPFRYSPDFHRDFLINGNSVEPAGSSSSSGAISVCTTVTGSGMSPYYNQQQQQQQQSQQHSISTTTPTNDTTDKIISTSITESIDELPSFGDVDESIMGSDLLNNL